MHGTLRGKITITDLLCYGGEERWNPISEIKECSVGIRQGGTEKKKKRHGRTLTLCREMEAASP